MILDLRDLFEKVGLGKYFSIFQEQEVSLGNRKGNTHGNIFFLLVAKVKQNTNSSLK